MSTQHKPESLDLEFLKTASNKRFAIVYSEWNSEIIDRLVKGAFNFFREIGISDEKIELLSVPGSFELVYGCSKISSTKKFDAIIAIGSIIRGETSHFKFISQSVFDGIKDLNLRATCPIVLCLLTDDNYQQSIERSGGKHGNKGYDCAAAAAKMSLI
ncbi:MAG: 6,7-dimethyl-8-ribityllumazine synthase [Cryomorphaceae bacterium]|jgi:6,7-dimethyl-8-ribityllumazine synthase|nr:MAG: 6,7-dimethyl-8-ribityllumazine synthase [Cryomorphaceae bacterium]|tara:strand:+ start:1282 stop:1755 length:474 start_codon:yes stop_codon:yes gene_type:complete